jgi:hypothetical protein
MIFKTFAPIAMAITQKRVYPGLSLILEILVHKKRATLVLPVPLGPVKR